MDETSWTNDCSTATVTDSSGNGNTGKSCPASTGPTGGNVGKFGKGGTFDATDDYVSITDSSTLNFSSNQDFTIATWIKSSQTAVSGRWPVIALKENPFSGGTRTGYEIALHNSTTDSRWYGSIYVAGTPYLVYGTSDIADGTWHHVVFQRIGSTIKTFQDGVQANTTAALGSDLTNTGVLTFGTRSDGNYPLNSTEDEMRIYNRALSPAEIAQLYNFAPGPVGYWKFEEGSGTAVNDASANGNNGALTNSPSWLQ